MLLTGSSQTGEKVVMNTLRDADEGRARPSVWPVYVAAGGVMTVGTLCLAIGLSLVFSGSGRGWLNTIFLSSTTLGLFGVLTTIGMIRLRPWGWWCGVLFAGVWTIQLAMLAAQSLHAPDVTFLASTIPFVATWLVAAVLLMVVLATRRRLFFPPKQDWEE